MTAVGTERQVLDLLVEHKLLKLHIQVGRYLLIHDGTTVTVVKLRLPLGRCSARSVVQLMVLQIKVKVLHIKTGIDIYSVIHDGKLR